MLLNFFEKEIDEKEFIKILHEEKNLNTLEINSLVNELLKENKGNRVVALKDSKIVDYDITEALNMPRVFDKHLYDIAKMISIWLTPKTKAQ